ncbi:ATP-grasp domain-containing protein [Sulfurimonas sp. HSL3-7]|uniref:ATP-grasp domain-containing protein n=1 Tax=Sulfonitrofixus jiaomeiensis TaxID=3131938 RepID=UPI0031F99E45
MQKRILFLGASDDQVPAIEYAKEQGHYVITCDYLPENPGHILADESYYVSTVDKEAVLELAKTLAIDAVLAFGSDSGAPTQAYVGNKLGLPSNPYESVVTLTRKDLLRTFMKEHGFYTPVSKSFTDYDTAYRDMALFKLPVLVKPVDSSGSNGITKLETVDALKNAFDAALSFSRAKKVLIEEFFDYEGHIVDGDGFIVDGKVVFHCCGDSQRSELVNPLVFVGINIPSVMPKTRIHHATSEIQRLLTLLNIKHGPFNAEFAFDKEGNFLLLDFGPRNGGGSVPKVIRNATGVYLTKYTVDAALGSDCSDLKMKETEGFYADYLVHTLEDGVFDHIWYSEEIKKNIIAQSITAKPGEKVIRMNRTGDRIGIILLKFSSLDEMQEKTYNMEKYLRVHVKKEAN